VKLALKSALAFGPNSQCRTIGQSWLIADGNELSTDDYGTVAPWLHLVFFQ
jgi:hypothetical protein